MDIPRGAAVATAAKLRIREFRNSMMSYCTDQKNWIDSVEAMIRLNWLRLVVRER